MPRQVDVEHRVVVLRRNIHELQRLRDAGVVDQHVDLAEGGDDLLGRLATIGEVADVAADSDVTV